MSDTIIGNYVYLTLFYFFVMLPLYTLFTLPVFLRFQEKSLEVKRGSIKSYFYFYAALYTLSIFAASLAYLLIQTGNQGTYYFIVHFGFVVPLSGLLLGPLFSKITQKKRKHLSVFTLNLLGSLSLFVTFTYMGLRVHLGLGL